MENLIQISESAQMERKSYIIEVSQVQQMKVKRTDKSVDIIYVPVKFQRQFTVLCSDIEKSNGNDYIIGTGIRAMNEFLCARKVANEHKAGLKMLKSNTRTHFTIKGENFFLDSKTIEELIGGESLFYSANKRLQLKFGATVYFGLCIAKMNEKAEREQSETLEAVNSELASELKVKQMALSAARKEKSAIMLQLENKISENE